VSRRCEKERDCNSKGRCDTEVAGEDTGLELGKGDKGDRDFDVGAVGGMGSERECMLDVGDSTAWRGDIGVGIETGE